MENLFIDSKQPRVLSLLSVFSKGRCSAVRGLAIQPLKIAFLSAVTVLFGLSACSSAPKAPPGIYTVRNEAARLAQMGAKALRDSDASAQGFYAEAYRLYTLTDDPEGRVRALEGLGRCLAAAGERLSEDDPEAVFIGSDASSLWSYATAIAEDSNNPEIEALAKLLKVELELAEGTAEEARKAVADAETAAELLKKRPMDRARAFRLSGSAYKILTAYTEALKALEEAAKLDLAEKSYAEHASDRYLAASVLSKMGKYDEAVTALSEALDSDRRVEHAAGIAGDYLALGLVAEKKGDHTAAQEFFRRADEIYTAARLDKLAAKAKLWRDAFIEN